MINIYIAKSIKPQKKYMAIIIENDELKKIVYFGQSGYSDYILSGGNENKKRAYIARHSKMGEDWSENGYLSSGFYARWVLWNKRSIQESLNDLNNKFPNLNFRYI